MSSHDKLLKEFDQHQKRFAATIEEYEEDLERMKENPKVSQTLCTKRDAQIETMVNFNNASDEVRKQFVKQHQTFTDNLGKIPPQALDLEEAVLGAVILESKSLPSVTPFLKPSHFYNDAYQRIYQAVLDLYEAGDPVDMRTVVMQLRKRGWVELIGGAYVIAEITAKVSSAANIEYHARCIIEFAIKRRLILLSGEICAQAYDDSTDVFELLDIINDEIEEITPPSQISKKIKLNPIEINGKNYEKQKTKIT